MKHIKFTYVDAVTGISVASQPAVNGPVFPAIAGLQFAWARESRYPTEVPEFFGTCPDDSSTQVDGVLGVFSQADWEGMQADEIKARGLDAVSLIVKIDADADSIRNAVLGGRTTEYQQAESDADAFKAAGYTGTVPDSVQSWLDAKNAVGANWTAQQAADDILTTAANWKGAQSQIRANRLLRKEQIKAATTQDDIDTAMSAWRTFAAQMRTNLGI